MLLGIKNVLSFIDIKIEFNIKKIILLIVEKILLFFFFFILYFFV